VNGKEIRVAELFAGIGGFRLGLERANSIRANEPAQQQGKAQFSSDNNCKSLKSNIHGATGKFRVIWANEWDKYACQIYRKNFGEKELIEGDIRKIHTDNIPDVDLIAAGFPCQPHSMSGKRKGFNEERGTVFYEIIRIAKTKRPQYILLENVKGLLSSGVNISTGFYTATKGNGKGEITSDLRIIKNQPERRWQEITVNVCAGYCFAEILNALQECGYEFTEWKTLNSKFFGVPQTRERVFIIGHLRGAGSRQVFPIGDDGAEDCSYGEVAGTLTGGGHSGGLHSNMTAIWQLPRNKDRKCLYNSDEQLQALRTCQRPPNPNIIAQALQTDGYLRSGSSFGTSNPQSSRNIRCLTPTECERLQGFPDGWTDCVSDTQRYKTLGNAVTVPVIQAIGELILEQPLEASK
jgi:DNA (cytosine-5)-methyltransferase 1